VTVRDPDDWRPGCSLDALAARAELYALLRDFFRERGVMEVQTALLGGHTVTEVHIHSIATVSGGYLQTSPEYQLKRLLAAGAGDVYQLGPVFRAGEAGRLHNPEFTMLEWYRLGFDDRMLMAEVAELVDRVLGPARYEEHPYRSLVPDEGLSRDEEDLALTEAIDRLGAGRHFITRYPAEQAALARLLPDDPSAAARFELVVDGVELANGYHELDDPLEQRRRFEADLAARRASGLPLPEVDERLLAALDAGLPDCAGVALGVDRLLMRKLGARSLADVVPFTSDRA
jgi:lysyl-tRNA synthetase class 2